MATFGCSGNATSWNTGPVHRRLGTVPRAELGHDLDAMMLTQALGFAVEEVAAFLAAQPAAYGAATTA